MATPSPEHRRTVFDAHPRITAACLVLFFAAATDVVFAHAYFWLTASRARGGPRRPAGPKTSPGTEPEATPFKVRSDVFHHGFAPLMKTTNSWGPIEYRFVTNSLGFMDRTPRIVDLESKGPRIVFIGDSFTEGVGVPYTKTFVGLVDEALAKKGVSVLNASALSYSPIIYYRKTKHLIEDVGLQLHALVVCIDISDVQDEVIYRFDEKGRVVWDDARKAKEDQANFRYGGEPVPDPGPDAAGSFLSRHTIGMARTYSYLRRLVKGGARPGAQSGRRRARWTLEPQVFEEYGREGLESASRHMDQLLELLKQHRIRLVVAVYPWPDQVLAGDVHSRQATFWREWAQQRGVDFIDYFPRFIDGSPPRAVLDRYFIPGDVHWNRTGHRLVAGAFLQYLETKPLGAASPSRSP